MPHQEVLFGGLSALLCDERVPLDRALDASDCELDDGSLRGRHGYRRAGPDSAGVFPASIVQQATFRRETLTEASSPTANRPSIPVVAGVWASAVYRVTYQITALTAASAQVRFSLSGNDADGVSRTTTGTYTEDIPVVAGQLSDINTQASVAGNHAPYFQVIVPSLSATVELQEVLLVLTGVPTGSPTGWIETNAEVVPFTITSAAPVNLSALIPAGTWIGAWIVIRGDTTGVSSSLFSPIAINGVSTGSGTSKSAATTYTEDLRLSSNCLAQINAFAGLSCPISLTWSGAGSETVESVSLVLIGNPQEVASQLLVRYRPGTVDVTDARTVPVVGGGVFEIEDPTSETAEDAVLTYVATPFGGTAKISGAQLGKYLYLASDEQTVSWQRMKPDYTLEAIARIPKGATPTAALSTLTVQKFTDSAVFDAETNIGGGSDSTVATDYVEVTGADGAGIRYPYDVAQDWSSINWVMVIVSPPTQSDGGGTCVISVATAAGNFEKIGETYDTAGSMSPVVVFCPLQGLSAATRAAVRRILIVRNGGTASFLVHGVLPIPSAPQAGPVEYFVDFYNSSTGAFSPPTETVTVTFDSSAVTIPTFHSVRRNRSSYADEGYPSADPDTLPPAVMFNKSAPAPFPSRYEFAGVATLSGTAPVGTFDTVRLMRVTPEGARIVKTKATSSGAAYSITDDTGASGLSKALYEGKGSPPPCMAMAAVGGRLVAGGDPANPSRLTVSDFVPFAQDADPHPQFATVPSKESDGHAFDIAPTASEQILWLGNGDGALYIGTNEAMYVMTDISPFAPIGTGEKPFKVWERGVIGRRAAVWSEDRLWWIAHDGIYTARNRADVDELTREIRRLFRTWFLPDSTCVLGYQDRKLIAIRGTRYLRFDTVTGVWTRGTLAHTHLHPAGWRDPTGSIQHFWMLDSEGYVNRWQPGTSPSDANRATSDAGEAIGPWSYSTGFEVTPVKTRPLRAFLDVSGSVAASFYKDTTSSPARSKTFPTSGQHEYAFPPDMAGYMLRVKLTAANTIQARRLMIEREATDGTGG